MRATWESAANGDFESFWRRSLHNGVIEGSAPEALSVQPAGNAALGSAADNGLEVIFRPDATIWDGRFACQQLVGCEAAQADPTDVGQHGGHCAGHGHGHGSVPRRRGGVERGRTHGQRPHRCGRVIPTMQSP
ncbi:MAG: hypothetical protein R3A10_08705 [Caldilineaceae bacterium]